MKLFCWKLCCGNVVAKLSSSSSSSSFKCQNLIALIMSNLQNKSNHFQQHTSSFS
ncbi:hypothetical protein ACMBCN_02955 [Candidatus Liberibacter asiaticus]|nr:hypothetical protein [Candidatus Liberibacter asiaticus]